MKKWEESIFYKEQKSRPLEGGSFKNDECESKETDSFQEMVLDESTINARKRCLRLLEYKPRTAAQLRKRLKDDGYESEQAEDAVKYAEKFGYVNDKKYAMEYVRVNCTKKSNKQLFMKLLQDGVDTDSINEALEIYSDIQEQTVYILAEKKLKQKNPKSEEELIKIIRNLVSKGFPYEISRQAVWSYWEKLTQED